MLQKGGADPSVWKDLIKEKTDWWNTYTGGVKKFLSGEAQHARGATLPVIRIGGGMITQMEQAEMPTILAEAKSDCAINKVTLCRS